MKRVLMTTVVLLTVSATALPAATSFSATTVRQQTVFRSGPEIHLMPSVGPVGTKVQVAGLGFQAGRRIKILYTIPSTEWPSRVLARATVSANGTFRTTFTITQALINKGAWVSYPLVLGSFPAGSPPGAGRIGRVTALIVTKGPIT